MGELNYRYFLAFLATHAAFFAYAVFVITSLMVGEVKDENLFNVTFLDTSTGREFKADFWNVAQYVITKNLGLSMLNIFAGIMDLVLVGFLTYHLYLVRVGHTTNESFKWSSLNKIHAKLTAAHSKFLKIQESRNGTVVGTDCALNGSISMKFKSSGEALDKIGQNVGAKINSVGGAGHEVESAVKNTTESSSSSSSSAPCSDFEALGDEYVCVDSTSILDHLKDEEQMKGSIGKTETMLKKEQEKVDVKEKEKEKEKQIVKQEGESSIDPPAVYRHPIREVIESNSDIPDILEKPPGPFPPNIYRKSFFENMR